MRRPSNPPTRRDGTEAGPANRRDHPAAAAWRALRPGSPEPGRIDVVKKESNGTAVYRLPRLGARGAAIVAKRSRRATSRVERTVYEEFLPEVPLPGPRYVGSVDDADGEFSWLFVEDVGGRKYRPHDPVDRVAAARWLGIMNTHVSEIAAADRLPRRGTDHYLGLLRSARGAIGPTVVDPRVEPGPRTTVARTIRHCDELEARWGELAAACESMPATLVHGDFIDNNVHLRTGGNGTVVLPVDWEKAGWGVPAEDISGVDRRAYASTVQERWPSLRPGDIEAAANAGRVFRCLVFLDWIATRLASQPVDRRIEEVEAWLDGFVRRRIWRRLRGKP